MPPTRTSNKNAEASSSSSKPDAKSKRQYQRRTQEHDSNAVPGVQKVKAALRQARRLLAKDKLAADVRVETERRIKALEAELNQAEAAKKERAFAVRYHKIKFFERQKVTRKLRQTKKGLEAASNDAEKKKLSSELQDLRVDLNYILHYPKMKKYISLFPPEVRKGEAVSAASEAEKKKTDKERAEVRKWIREQMEQGDLPGEPEIELGSQHGKSRAQKWPQEKNAASAPSMSKEEVEERDEFFDDDDEDSS
ncbi:rRNA-processing protein EFG1 [Psilocybe cubensis]|uniref:rRNA-processing protein EFG1 n=2 Tax=Psilocybe cubensis TaxID=181762 RepID=A0ACB8HEL7_PSICU|nr:rRNA-processing protein EFG1 [Psilocybe cubensis]KAH9485614.1 rRNA-processing protein EFG1 [Psilocybe cubensis]